jgi:N-acetylglucosaminyl-diphospho-decaprenol L-rhamnosyltransferase
VAAAPAVPPVPEAVAAVVVDHDTGPLLSGCVRSLLDDGVATVVVVENGAPGGAEAALGELLTDGPEGRVRVVRPGANLGYGAGVNRGLAALAAGSSPEWVLVSNPDLEVHPGTLDALRRALEANPAWALVGPRIFTDAGEVYPSVRAFPSFTDAAGHALLAVFKPDNPFTKRYNPGTPEGDVVTGAGWVSGSCFLARRSALEELGGFDESYFMYLEDTDLCWRAHHAGWGVGFAGTAAVTHIQGVSTARDPYRMMVAHHRSALRFTFRTTTGWRRLALPLAVLVLGARLAMATLRIARTGA